MLKILCCQERMKSCSKAVEYGEKQSGDKNLAMHSSQKSNRPVSETFFVND